MAVDGAIGVALVDYESGMSLATLGIDDTIEDVLITLGDHYHVIRLLPADRGSLFLYLALDRSRANLALARHSLKRVEGHLEV
ncbi:hypothetical protein [Streptomyces mayteni]